MLNLQVRQFLRINASGKEFFKYLLIIQEKGYVEEHVFNVDETGLIYKDTGKQTYIMQMVFGLMTME